MIARFFQGAAGSTGSTMVGGTIADIWRTHEYAAFPFFERDEKLIHYSGT